MKNLKLSPDAVAGSVAATPTGSPVAEPVAAPAPVAAGPDVATTIGNDASAVLGAAAPFASLAGPYGAMVMVAATGALAVYKSLVPVIEDMVNKGLVSVADQATLAAAYQDVAVTHATAFQGPEWKQD